MLDDSTLQPLKLHGRVTVPRWFGKVIIDPNTKECIMASAKNDIEGGKVYVWFDLSDKEIKQMFPELHEYLVLNCNRRTIRDQMKQAISGGQFEIKAKPKN